MEKIKINDMQTKGVVFIVKYQSYDTKIGAVGLEQEATLNINFNAISIAYLKNEVGIGGTVSVEIKNKPKNPLNESEGFWVNITKVDMTSGVKGEIPVTDEIGNNIPTPQAGLMSQREIGMCAGGMLKCYYYNHTAKDNEEILERYRAFVLELENNG